MQDIDLAAVFERDSYTLTLEGELTASYQTVDPNDTSKTLTKPLKSGESVTGDGSYGIQIPIPAIQRLR